MVLDITIIGFLTLQTFLGWRRGLMWQAAGVVSIVFGVALGLWLGPWLSGYAAAYITSDPFRARLIAFLFVAGAVGFGLRLAAAWAEACSESGVPQPEREKRRREDRILGGIFGALKGCVLALIVVAAAAAISPRSPLWKSSQLAGPLAVAGSRLLPDGAVEKIKSWTVQSATDLQRGLEIKS